LVQLAFDARNLREAEEGVARREARVKESEEELRRRGEAVDEEEGEEGESMDWEVGGSEAPRRARRARRAAEAGEEDDATDRNGERELERAHTIISITTRRRMKNT
jgi:hypothetical protein